MQGLPEEWREMLKRSGITKDDVKAHPQHVLDVLQFQTIGQCRPPPPREAELRAMLKEGLTAGLPPLTHAPLLMRRGGTQRYRSAWRTHASCTQAW